MAEEERQGLKEALTMNFHEPVNQIAVHIAVLISKIARWDCPKEWPTLLPTLLQAIGSSEMLIQHRSLLTLHHVVKVMSSKRLLGLFINNLIFDHTSTCDCILKVTDMHFSNSLPLCTRLY